MKPANPSDSIEVQALRVGMFVHLDLGWMSHPFALGSFRIASAEQIATIRTLGLKRVRWSPQHSDSAAIRARGDDAPASQIADFIDEPQPCAPPVVPARPERRGRLATEHAALALCERQFGEAAADCERLTALVVLKPQQARVQAETLCTALLDKMLGAGDLCIRLLADAAGDKAPVHALNVTIVSLLMGRTFGLPEADMLDLGVGALLHDIGKIDLAQRLPERSRQHADSRSGVDSHQHEEHVAHGVAHGRAMGLSQGALLVLAQHHEHADGSGYPLRINSDRMTAAARIVSLVNCYDNLCNPTPPAIALMPHDALSTLFAQGRSKFDTSILGAFIRMMGVYPPGSTVQLTDDRFALVVGVNSSRPLKPRVLVHEPGLAREDALVADLESLPGLGIRRSMRPQQLPRQSLDFLAPRAGVAYFFEPAGQRMQSV